METLDQRRRRPPTEVDSTAGEAEPNYGTALGQGLQESEGQVGPQVLGVATPVAQRMGPPVSSGSPNLMELGLVASPFHSSRVQEEIELRRSRPASLDEDGRMLAQARQDAGDVVLEPDYASRLFSGSAAEERVRVARVQTTSEDPAESALVEVRRDSGPGEEGQPHAGVSRSEVGNPGSLLLNGCIPESRREEVRASGTGPAEAGSSGSLLLHGSSQMLAAREGLDSRGAG